MTPPISDEHRMVLEGYIARLRREASGTMRKAEEKYLLAKQLEADLSQRPSSEVERANAPVTQAVEPQYNDASAYTFDWSPLKRLTAEAAARHDVMERAGYSRKQIDYYDRHPEQWNGAKTYTWERDDEQNGYECAQVSYAGSAPGADDTLESKPQDVCPRGWTGGCKPSTCSGGCSASRVD